MKSRIWPVFFQVCSALLILSVVCLPGCTSPEPIEEVAEVEVLARTAFTDRIENFFEYSPLRSGEESEFLIHLTDLTDGSPVGNARVDLLVRRPETQAEVAQTTALVGRVTGIYVAELVAPEAGTYDIEFHVQTSEIDETVLLSGFEVE